MTSTSELPVPRSGERNVLVTSALPYVNNYPHLGNIIGAVLSADVYARFLRQRRVNVIYICGTDEYGTATETKAQEENVTPQEICDKYHALHREVYTWFDIAFDEFGRTSTEKQTEIVQEIFWDVYNQGYIEEDVMVQLYCEAKCNRFLADRYVRGTCPNCGYEDARGDQCDNCGRMLNPSELVQPRCATCEFPPLNRSTRHLFLNLPKVQPQLQDWVEKASEKGKWTANAKAMTDTWLRDGLKKRCITRDLSWGVPVPLDGFTDKVFYVWFDAPVGYVSITAAACGDAWKQWWLPAYEDENEESVNVELVQFMGKDNVPFHTIVFPGALLATGRQWTKLHHISTSEYLTYENGKFSKSRGVGVFGNDAKETGIPPEVWRYYLLLNRPEGSDSAFTWADLAVKNNDELINNLGNFINRTVTFLYKYFDATVPDIIQDDAEDVEFTEKVNNELQEYVELLEKVSLKAGLKKAMAISSIGNLYLQRKAPWALLKEDKKAEAGSCLTFAANLAVLVVALLEPFMGSNFSRKVFDQLGLVHQLGVNNIIPDKFDPHKWVKPGMKTKAPVILFTPLQTARVSALREKYSGGQAAGAKEDTLIEMRFALDLRVGQIVEIQEHPDSERLFIAKVDVGEEAGPRTAVAGLRDHYTLAELQNRMVAVVCNLAPVTLAGVHSQAMILAAEKKKVMEVLAVQDLSRGEQLVPEGCTFIPNNVPLDRKAFQAASKPLRVGSEGSIVFNKAHKVMGVNVSKVAEGGKVK